MIGVLIYLSFRGPSEAESINLGHILILQALINWPHFMASYRLLYSPVSNVKKHPFATIYVPVLLIVLASIAIFTGQGVQANTLYVNQTLVYFFWLGAAFYLAWHYTGQAWGMVCSFAFLAGVKMDSAERLMIRASLRVLLVWHVVWGAQDLPAAWLGFVHPYLLDILHLVTITAFITFATGIIGFIRISKRTGLTPTPQMIAPWIAIHLWYLTLNFEPNMYLFVQFSHALQYLIFPLRVELNRKGHHKTGKNVFTQFRLGISLYLALVCIGIVVFYLPEVVFQHGNQAFTIAVLVASVISIHHYFVDGCIWKISNPDVRAQLFAHVVPKRN